MNRLDDTDADLVKGFLEATEGLRASAVGRVCGLDGQTIQNLRFGRINKIRRNTRDRILNYLSRHAHGFNHERSSP